MPYRECPQYDHCSCNECPLDPDVALRTRLPGEPRCGALRSTRERIAAKHPELLPTGGLLRRERAADSASARSKAVYQSLPEDHPSKEGLRKGREALLAKRREKLQFTASGAKSGIDETQRDSE